jgi:hypothetical protein
MSKDEIRQLVLNKISTKYNQIQIEKQNLQNKKYVLDEQQNINCKNNFNVLKINESNKQFITQSNKQFIKQSNKQFNNRENKNKIIKNHTTYKTYKTYKTLCKTLKNAVWDKFICSENGIGMCYCCKYREIDSKHFECGHVVARSLGGKNCVDNLRPICSLCNKSM